MPIQLLDAHESDAIFWRGDEALLMIFLLLQFVSHFTVAASVTIRLVRRDRRTKKIHKYRRQISNYVDRIPLRGNRSPTS